ncbi:MAG: hypothetical protein J6Z11_12215, partial [Candidatus Riflebacteria bacterium]|nr:hypothetical protein [Candidatus Riflebacteria bacterium]
IGCIRPYMFAKYLTKFGHKVTVIRKGNINGKPDDFYNSRIEGLEVISYLGENCEAEMFEKGKLKINNLKQSKTNKILDYINNNSFLIKIKYFFSKPYSIIKTILECQKEYKLLKKTINRLFKDGRTFDIVFSTYSGMSNIYAGKYVKKLFNCKWIMDFRDPIVRPGVEGWLFSLFFKPVQNFAILKSDVCCSVSEDLSKCLSESIKNKKRVIALNNGYEPYTSIKNLKIENKLIICYTGIFYPGRTLAAATAVIKSISELIKKNMIDSSKIKIVHAGPHADLLKKVLGEYGLLNIFEDHGYVTRKEALNIQLNSDLFLLLSWNTKYEQGVLTGKFYEGIRANKPILASVFGDVPNSELYRLNEKYNYGFCYETCKYDEEFDKMSDYIYNLYNQKINRGFIDYNPSPTLSTDFYYETITRKLEKICLELTKL